MIICSKISNELLEWLIYEIETKKYNRFKCEKLLKIAIKNN